MRRGLRRHKASNILDKRPRKLTGLSADQERKREEERTKTREEFYRASEHARHTHAPLSGDRCRQRARLQPRLYRLADITRQVASRQTRARGSSTRTFPTCSRFACARSWPDFLKSGSGITRRRKPKRFCVIIVTPGHSNKAGRRGGRKKRL